MPKRDPVPSINKANLFIGIGMIAALVGVLGLLLGYFVGQQTSASDTPSMRTTPQLVDGLRQGVHEHQDFAVHVKGSRISFNDDRFLSTEGTDKSPNVHLHAPRTDVAHLHREQTTYDEFFLSLGMELTDSCLKLVTGERLCNDTTNSLKFVVNGVRVDKLQFERMTDLGRVLISYGPVAASLQGELASVGDEACIPGENCAERLPPGGLEKEPCAKSAGECH